MGLDGGHRGDWVVVTGLRVLDGRVVAAQMSSLA
jgi:hypothetical protein